MSPRLLRISLLTLTNLVWIAVQSESQPLPAGHQGSESGISSEIAGYRNWQKANAAPVWYDSSIAAMCAAATPQSSPRGPHSDKFILVYVNETGRESLLRQKTPVFPVGSIIVKEKLASADSQSAELLTVMLKRESGFNPDSGNWEYAVVDGTATKVIAQGKLVNCQSCHVARKPTDFVFRAYLSAESKAGLR
jgi:hypothetical protein